MLHMTVEEHSLALWIDTTVSIGQVLHQGPWNILRRHFNFVGLQDTRRQL